MTGWLWKIVAVCVAAILLLAWCGKIGPNRTDEHGMTALMYAAQRGDRAEAERLINRFASVNKQVPTRDLRELIAFLSWMQELPKSDIGYTALHYASQGGHVEVVQLLIDKGADVNIAGRGGTTALDLAAFRSSLPMMDLLVRSGARLEPRQLVMAVSRGTVESVRFFLEHGGSPHAVDTRSNSATPLVILAAQRGDPEILKLLIDAGADVNAKDKNGWSALRHLSRLESRRPGFERDTAEIRRQLETAGAGDAAGAKAAALFEAVLARDAAAVRLALSDGANPNGKDDRGVPPLIYAGGLGETEIVAALVDAGADVNADPENDTTPLNAAIRGGSLEAVKKLLAAGASANKPDRLKQTPLQVASSHGQSEISALLLESRAAVGPRALPLAALRGSADQVRMLLARGADPNAGGGLALSEAARGCLKQDNTEVIRMLLDAGAKPKRADDTGYSPLHRAAALCPAEAVRLMLRRGADPNARDLSGSTPLISAAASGNLDGVRVLVEARVDVNARDDSGKTALAWAANHPEVQEALRRAGAQ